MSVASSPSPCAEDEAIFSATLLNLVLAMGIGLLIGSERERRKAETSSNGAGVRTFAVAALSGAVAAAVGGGLLLAVVAALAAVFAGLSYWLTRDADPGITTELALTLTVLLGGLTMTEPAAAAGAGVAVALILAAHKRLHHFVGAVLTEEEVSAALVLGAAAFVVMPLLPNEPMGPFGALNPYRIWRLVVLVLAIGAAGHVAVRALGPRFGLPVAGLASGFVSSSATIGAMGARAAKAPEMLAACTAGAVLSTVATVVQLAAVVGSASPETLRAIVGMLAGAGVAAIGYGAVFTLKALRQTTDEAADPGKPFRLSTALVFATILAAVLVLAAALRTWFGETGAMIAAAIAGIVDAHAAAISIAALVAEGKLTPAAAVLPILAGFTTNTIVKIVLASTNGGRAFALQVIPGLLLVAAGAWAGALIPLPF